MTDFSASRARAGVLFDLDGTLANTLDDITDALNRSLATINRSRVDIDQVRGWVGDGVTELVRRALGGGDDATLALAVNLVRDDYSRHLLDRTRLYPGVDEMLRRLHDDGRALAVLSNKPHDLTRRVVSGLGIGSWFDVVQGCVRPEERKPSPLAALRIAARWSLPPSGVVMVGDSEADAAMASTAGMEFVGVTWGYRSREALRAAGVTRFADAPSDVMTEPIVGPE